MPSQASRHQHHYDTPIYDTKPQVLRFDSVDGIYEPSGIFNKISGSLVMFPSNGTELWPGGTRAIPVARQGTGISLG